MILSIILIQSFNKLKMYNVLIQQDERAGGWNWGVAVCGKRPWVADGRGRSELMGGGCKGY